MSEEKVFEMSLPATIQGCYAVIRELSVQDGSPITIQDVGFPNQDDGPPSEIDVSIGSVPEIMGFASGSISLVKISDNRTWVRFHKTTEASPLTMGMILEDDEKKALLERAIADAHELVAASHDAFLERVTELRMVD